MTTEEEEEEEDSGIINGGTRGEKGRRIEGAHKMDLRRSAHAAAVFTQTK